ncbi:MAG: cyclodeaminase/cyclohydrolase family protein [Erysipelotrichaceae bacterium]|nr:cyclodeaminase/cyclohydrolase family protein [Erysipelotrichaceae bacterium]
MKLIDLSVNDFYKELASDSPAPGGGSVAAVEASFGCGLLSMVCELTAKNKKYLEKAAKYKAIQAEADQLAKEALETIDKDTEAFLAVSNAFSLPKETEEEKEIRKQTIQEGLKGCCYPPMQTMNIAYLGLKQIETVSEDYNTNAASDLGSAVAALKAALQSAYLNVLINIGGIQDTDFTEKMNDQAEELYQISNKLAETLSQKITDSLK